MRTKKIELKLKTFDELSEEQKSEVIGKNRYINVEHDFWNDFLLEEFLNKVKEKTIFEFEADDIVWAVGGRDACFGVYGKTVEGQINEKYADKGVLDVGVPNKVGVGLNHMGGGICQPVHTQYSRADIDFEDDISESEADTLTKEINEQIDTVIELAQEYFKKNTQLYDDLTDDENVADTLRINEYEFNDETLEIEG